MSQSNGSKQQFGCGQNGCGQNDVLCPNCEKSFMASTQTKCPDGNPLCSDENPCDLCLTTAQSLVEMSGGAAGGKARDVIPLQEFKAGCSGRLCDECQKPEGSNTLECGICASIAESPLNPAQPNIPYHPDFGPMRNSFGQCTGATAKSTLDAFNASFDDSKKNGFPFTGINEFKRRASFLRSLLSHGVIIGIEGFNNSCFLNVCFWTLSQGNMHERINTNCLSGHILYKILWDLRCGLFVGRDIVEAFRLSLREYPVFQRNMSETGMDDPSYLLWLLEDDEVGILRKGPILSETGCSFLINEVQGENPVSSIHEALCASVASPSPVPEDGSIISFQLCQQKGNGRFTRQILGTDFEFPHDGVILAGKLLRPTMFIIYISQYYLIVLCVGEAFFLSNSLSASQCGHFLPETREISEQEAMELFRTQAHTIVFECIRDVPPPPYPHSCAFDDCVPPPLPIPCSSGHLVLQPQQSQENVVVWYVDEYRRYDPQEHVLRSIPTGRIIDGIKAGTYQVQEKVTRKMIDIKLREVQSDDAPPIQRSVPQFARDLQPRTPTSSQEIIVDDIIVSETKWSCRGCKDFFGKVEKMPHPRYPQAFMEVYYYDTVSHTTLKDLIDFLNFIKRIQ